MKTKTEIQKRLAELVAERRRLLNEVEDRSKPFDQQKFDDALAAIVEEERRISSTRLSQLRKRKALFSRP